MAARVVAPSGEELPGIGNNPASGLGEPAALLGSQGSGRGAYGESETQALSQLSDLVVMGISEKDPRPGPASAAPNVASLRLSQTQEEQGLPLPSTLPSQPELPLPQLGCGEGSTAATGVAAGEGSGAAGLGHAQHAPEKVGNGAGPVPATAIHASLGVGGSADGGRGGSKATRRGPMDEMRQLVRILVKVIPHSVAFLAVSEEGGGGNRISEDQIKSYLDRTLGEAPRPQWGVPYGWGQYMSVLFSWCSGRVITQEQAMRCAKREPGRSWEAIEQEMLKIGLQPSTWPLPLNRKALDESFKNPVLQPMPSNVPAKRPLDNVVLLPSKKRAAPSLAGVTSESTSELEVWERVRDLLNTAAQRVGTTPREQQGELALVRGQVYAQVERLIKAPMLAPTPAAVGNLPGSVQMVPVMVQGPNGQAVLAYQLQNAQLTQQAVTLQGGLSALGPLMAAQAQAAAAAAAATGAAPQGAAHTSEAAGQLLMSHLSNSFGDNSRARSAFQPTSMAACTGAAPGEAGSGNDNECGSSRGSSGTDTEEDEAAPHAADPAPAQAAATPFSRAASAPLQPPLLYRPTAVKATVMAPSLAHAQSMEHLAHVLAGNASATSITGGAAAISAAGGVGGGDAGSMLLGGVSGPPLTMMVDPASIPGAMMLQGNALAALQGFAGGANGLMLQQGAQVSLPLGVSLQQSARINPATYLLQSADPNAPAATMLQAQGSGAVGHPPATVSWAPSVQALLK